MDKPTWLSINQHLQDSELVLHTEAQEGDDFIPRDGFLLGSPLESTINLYKDLQLEYRQSVSHHKVGFPSKIELLWSQLGKPSFGYGVYFAWVGWTLPNWCPSNVLLSFVLLEPSHRL